MSKLPIAFKTSYLGQPKEIRKQWAAYTLYDHDLKEYVHVGEIRLSQLATLNDTFNNPRVIQDRLYQVDVFDISENPAWCARAAAIKRRELNLPVLPRPRASVVECVTTGERFNSATAAAIAHGISASNLSNHLNNKPGFSHVGGKVYKKVISGQ